MLNKIFGCIDKVSLLSISFNFSIQTLTNLDILNVFHRFQPSVLIDTCRYFAIGPSPESSNACAFVQSYTAKFILLTFTTVTSEVLEQK